MSEGAHERYRSFEDFYPFYLSQHQTTVNRRLHFIGSVLVLVILAAVIAGASAWWLLAMPVVGYGFAWVGHFFFERNRPATFQYPVWSLMGDWLMFWQTLTGKMRF